jgi:hypothetical protein
LNKAKAKADTIVCKSNLRQQGIGLATYVSDYQAYPQLTTEIAQASGQFWFQVLQPYVGDRWPGDNVKSTAGPIQYLTDTNSGHHVFMCPGYDRIHGVYFHPGGNIFVEKYGGAGAYAYNAIDGLDINTFGFGGVPLPFMQPYELRPIREAQVASPSRMITIGDSTIGSPEPYGPDQIGIAIAPLVLFTSPRKSPTAQDKGMLQRHAGIWNQSFVDGHVESGKRETFFLWTDEVLKLWNRDNQAHKDAWLSGAPILPNP